ncbi:hypothetical protein [Streptomyces sp. NPDC006333]|uniref:hypothetical protein n=1 Tax=Streptomyces sp. NPDC006333 TaxID=3156753 RepID=UPI0033BB52AE
MVHHENRRLRLDADGNRALNSGRRRGRAVPEPDGDLDVDVGLQALDVQVVAVAGYHLGAGGGHSVVVTEIGVRVVDLHDAAAGCGLAPVCGQERHDAAALLLVGDLM